MARRTRSAKFKLTDIPTDVLSMCMDKLSNASLAAIAVLSSEMNAAVVYQMATRSKVQHAKLTRLRYVVSSTVGLQLCYGYAKAAVGEPQRPFMAGVNTVLEIVDQGISEVALVGHLSSASILCLLMITVNYTQFAQP